MILGIPIPIWLGVLGAILVHGIGIYKLLNLQFQDLVFTHYKNMFLQLIQHPHLEILEIIIPVVVETIGGQDEIVKINKLRNRPVRSSAHP